MCTPADNELMAPSPVTNLFIFLKIYKDVFYLNREENKNWLIWICKSTVYLFRGLESKVSGS
jgi:hypothetical protein